MTQRVQVANPQLDMRVFHENVYSGQEPLTIVGIRKDQLELEGDFSGGTHAVTQKDWLPLIGTFQVKKVCQEKSRPNGCQLHNLHCAYPNCESVVDWEEGKTIYNQTDPHTPK